MYCTHLVSGRESTPLQVARAPQERRYYLACPYSLPQHILATFPTAPPTQYQLPEGREERGTLGAPQIDVALVPGEERTIPNPARASGYRGVVRCLVRLGKGREKKVHLTRPITYTT